MADAKQQQQQTAADDKTDVLVGLVERLAAEAKAVSDAVTSAQQYNATVEPITRPLAVLVQNAYNAPEAFTAALEAVKTATTERWDAEASTAILPTLDTVRFLSDLLKPVDLSTLGTDEGDRVAATIDKVRDLSGIMFTVSDDATAAAEMALAAWAGAKASLLAEMAPKVTTREVPSNTGTGKAGAWLTEHGYRVAYTSDKTGQTYYTASNAGAMLHDVAQRYAADHNVPRPYRGEAIHTGIKEGLDFLLNRNTPRDAVVSVPGFVLKRDYPRA